MVDISSTVWGVSNFKQYPMWAAVSRGLDCGHCHTEIPDGYTLFHWDSADHPQSDGTQVHCDHWICLACMSRTLRKWTTDAMNEVIHAPV